VKPRSLRPQKVGLFDVLEALMERLRDGSIAPLGGPHEFPDREIRIGALDLLHEGIEGGEKRLDVR